MLLGVALVGNEQGDVASSPRPIIRGGSLTTLERYFIFQVQVLLLPCSVVWDDHFFAPWIPHPTDPTCPDLPETFLALAESPTSQEALSSVKWR